MREDESYTYIWVCPKTDKEITKEERAYSFGICPRCGYDNEGTFTHTTRLIGKWVRPNLFEFILGKRKIFKPLGVALGRDNDY